MTEDYEQMNDIERREFIQNNVYTHEPTYEQLQAENIQLESRIAEQGSELNRYDENVSNLAVECGHLKDRIAELEGAAQWLTSNVISEGGIVEPYYSVAQKYIDNLRTILNKHV